MNGVAFLFELFDDCLQVDGRPEHNGIGDKIETSHLVDLSLIPALPDFTLVGKEQKPPEAMQGLPFVELSVNIRAHLLT